MTERSELVERLDALADRVEYRPGYSILVGVTDGMKYPFLQVLHLRPDSTTGKVVVGKGGKAYISQWATDSEVFQTIFGLYKAYEEHEVREFFKVDGKRVFGPHIDTMALAEVCDRLDARPAT